MGPGWINARDQNHFSYPGQMPGDRQQAKNKSVLPPFCLCLPLTNPVRTPNREAVGKGETPAEFQTTKKNVELQI